MLKIENLRLIPLITAEFLQKKLKQACKNMKYLSNLFVLKVRNDICQCELI